MDADHVARELQWAAWERMTPDQRWRISAQLSEMVLAARDERLRRTYPQAGPDELRRLRLAEILRGYDG